MKKTALNKNDYVSLQSLSSGMAGEKDFMHRFKIGQSKIEAMGLKTKIGKNALLGIKELKNHPEKRAIDFINAFKNKNIKMIIANIGGDDSHRIIPYLDLQIITKNPKPILGYSDTTSLHLLLYSLGIQSYYGPSVLDGFAENKAMHKLTLKSMNNVLFHDENKNQKIISSKTWTSQFLDWKNLALDRIKRDMIKEQHGHIWINWKQDLRGPLLGGCLDTIVKIKNLPFFPKLKLWENAIIFLETSEAKMKPETFEKALTMLEDEFRVCQAILFGKPKDEAFFDQYLKIIKQKINKPVVFNLNFGHTAPFYTIPYGAIATIKWHQKIIKISK